MSSVRALYKASSRCISTLPTQSYRTHRPIALRFANLYSGPTKPVSSIPNSRSIKTTAATAMPNQYTEAHKLDNLIKGPDNRPTALQIIKDNNLTNALPDKVFVVTGASAGIGPETARALASTGARVFCAARNLPKAREACASFLEEGRVELLEMDNGNLESVRKAAKEFLERSGGKLNVLVCNAGIMAAPKEKTKDGFESQFGTNHVAHFLFFCLVRDALLKSSTPEFQSRVVCVSSSGHMAGEVQFGDYGFDKAEYTPWKGYGQSKTANIYMANEIENRYAAKGLHGLSLHPGGIWTGLQKFVSEETMKGWKARPNVEKILKSTEQGAATTVLAAVGKHYEGVGRVYMEDCDTTELTKTGEGGHVAYAFDKEKEARLWKDSLEMVGLPAED